MTQTELYKLLNGINQQVGSTYTLVLDDANMMVEMNNPLANNVIIPSNANVPFPIGTQIAFSQVGIGQTSIVGDTGVVVRNAGIVGGQYRTSFMYKRGINEWVYCAGGAGGSSITQLGTPTLNASVISSSEIDLTWGNVTNGVTYILDFSTDNINFSNLSTGGALSFIHTGRTSSTIYYYRLKVQASGFSDSNYATISETTSSGSGTTLTAPVMSTPTVVSGTEIDLGWTDPNTTPNESGFSIERSLNGTSGWAIVYTPAANATTQADLGRSPGTQYYYRMRAIGNGTTTVTSSYSNSVSATTSSIPQLNAPVLSSPTVISATELDLAFTDTNSSPNESSLEIQYSDDNVSWNPLATPVANTTTYNDTSIPTGGTLRYYRVRAVGNGTTSITSAWSNVVSDTTPAGAWSYSQKFDGVTPPAMPADWVHTGAFTAAYGLATSSPNVMEMPANGSVVMTAMKNAVDGNSGNIRVSINIKIVSSNPHEIIVLGRASTTTWNTMNAYGLKIWINNETSSTNGVSLLKGVGGTFNALGSGTSVGTGSTLAANVWYRFTLVMTDIGGSTKVDAIVQRVSDGFYLNSSGAFVTGAEQIAYTNTDSSPITGAGYGGIASFIIKTAEHVMDDFLMTQ